MFRDGVKKTVRFPRVEEISDSFRFLLQRRFGFGTKIFFFGYFSMKLVGHR
jgi:hypothetical protein